MNDNRFSVSTVDGEKKNGIHMGASIISRPLRSSAETVERGAGGVSPTTQPETWLHDAGWRRKRSLAQLTREALPRMENYRNSKRALKRPSLGELHGDNLIAEENEKELRQRDTKSPTPAIGIKLGWIQGVLIPCLLNIWGVMLFLRISWVVSQAGVGLTLLIIAISAIVCVITTLSMSAICTNGEVKGGGIYYIISRSLGPEFGASVGIIFAFANAVAASMNTIGFCDSMNDLLRSYDLKIIDGALNDVRIVGAVALLIMCIICAVGMDWESKAQNFLIAIIVGAMVDFVVGTIMGPKDTKEIAEGFVGWSTSTLSENFKPDFRYSADLNQDFFSVFAIFFPSVTGIQAGANISGDLKDPGSAIPKGTLLALLISMVSYALMVLFAGGGALRDASGNITDLIIVNGSVTNYTSLAHCALDTNSSCEYGLHNSYSVMQLMSAWGPFIYAGCWAATLSTALTNLLSVPRLIQALGVDRIYPGLIFFSKPYGKHGEPYRGYVLTFFVSLLFLLIADLNTIAPLITNFYLASYALINFCTFHAGSVQPISWRPTFRCNLWLSLAGFMLCVGIMMVISWVMALITTFIFMTLYLLVLYSKPDARWGSSTEAQRYQDTIATILQISRGTEHIKSYSPQLLVMAGKPYSRPALLDIGHLITRMGSFMIVADVEKADMEYDERTSRIHLGEDWLQTRKNRAFFVLLTGISLERGVMALAQAAGLGRLQPNIMLIGFKEKWLTCETKELASYVKVIQNAIEEQLAIAIFRAPRSARPSRSIEDGLLAPSTSTYRGRSEQTHSQLVALMHSNSDIEVNSTNKSAVEPSQSSSARRKSSNTHFVSLSDLKRNMSVVPPLAVESDSSPLDTWWLYEDGGLNILLPYIIARRGMKEKKPLRIFALPRGGYSIEDAHKYLEALLAKYRINYTELNLIQGLDSPPSAASWDLFDSLSANFKTEQLNSDVLITQAELKRQYSKTCRHLRLRELLLEHSINAPLIVMSLPIPRKGLVSAAMYLTWLDILSRGLPPMLFVRGNDASVLDA